MLFDYVHIIEYIKLCNNSFITYTTLLDIMYHIKKDKRSQKSARIITDTVMEILKVKKFEDMTISDIEKKSYIARSTFYRLFDNTTDVLAYKCDQIFEELNAIHAHFSCKTLEEIMILTGEYWMQNAMILEVLSRSAYQNMLQESFERHFPKVVENFLGKEKKNSIACDPYLSALITSIISTSLLTWIKQGKKESSVELWKKITESYKSLLFIMK